MTMGKLLKGIAKFTIATAAVGGLCYIFKDQIKESKIYKDNNMDEKIQKVKTTIKEKMPKAFDNEEDYVDENEIFFNDEDLAAEDVKRDYVDLAEESGDEPKDEVPTIDL